ncbi:putative chromodomain-helicase-DNA-binding protein 1-like isoform X1 [Capsicum annuum]|nr:putative chromodomain-helicase-DNA-binding protein 1-like isoform X1 [Capsicum annuum]
MGRPGLERCDVWYDVTRLRRKRAHSWNKESDPENSDVFRLKRQIRKTKNMDEDYVQYLMLLLDYDEEPKCYANEGGNEGLTGGGDRLSHDVNEEGTEFEDEDEDEDDLEYRKFLANAKPNGTALVAKVDSGDGFPVYVEFEKEDGSDDEYEYLGRGKQQDSGNEKDLGDVGCKDKVESQPSSRIDLENNNNRSAGDDNVVIEPFGSVTLKETEPTSQQLSLGENGACKRRQKGETKNRPNKEQKKGKGRRSAKVTTKDEGDEIDEDYANLLGKFICKNWRTPASFMKKYNLKTKKSSRTLLGDDSNVSVGDIDMSHEPSDPLSPKKKKRGRPRKKNSTKENDAWKKKGKGEKRKRSNKKQTEKKRRKLADVPFDEDVAGRKSVDDTVKEEITDVDEAPFEIGHNSECNASDEDLQIVVNDNGTFGKEGRSNIMEVSSEKHSENVVDICPRETVRSDFWWQVKALLEMPYDQREYTGLLEAVKSRKPILKDKDLRNGKFYLSRRLGKSYLDHYKDLHDKLKEFDNDNMKKLNILRGFFFWLQNLTQAGAFRPWTDPEWLSLLDNATVPTLISMNNQAGTVW